MESNFYKVTPAIEIMEKVKLEPRPNFLWYGIPEGAIGLICGIAKTGKTTFAENLAISIAIGRRSFFNYKMEGRPRKVLFINLEESYKLRSRRNMKQTSVLTQYEKTLFEQNYISTPLNFPDFIVTDENWNKLKEYIINSEAEVIFIDSLSHLIPKNIEDSTTVLKFIKDKLRPNISSLGKTVIIVHHSTKGNESPMDESNGIAGSRVILQEFQFAIGLSNIPNRNGGNYCCMLYNKHIHKDDTSAVLYTIDSDGWVINNGVANKHDLYKNAKPDLRNDDRNRNRILRFIKNQHNQGNQDIKTTDLYSEFLNSKQMSRDTLHKWLKVLLKDKLIKKYGHGVYRYLGN